MLSVQVNLRTILKNVIAIKKRLQSGTKFCAVVKANAYGLGLERISKLLVPYVDCFAVANIDEAIALRKFGIKQDILLLGICENLNAAIKHNIIISVENYAQAENIIKQKLHPRIHLAVNTGMNRFGITSVHELRKTLQKLNQERVEGVYTHLAYESEQPTAINTALTRFKKLIHICRQYYPNLITHAGCSGTITYPSAHLNMMRIGKALYGGVTGTHTAITVTSQIVAIKKLKPGDTVGYNGTFTATRPTVVGVVRGGYANGIPIQFSNTALVLVGKQKCRVVGRVCMDYFFIDISNVTNPLQKRVTIIANTPGQTLLEMAQQTNMVTCNLLLSLQQANR